MNGRTASALCAALVVSFSAFGKTHSNTQSRLPNGNYLIDLSGDGIAEYVVVDGQNIYGAELTYEAHGLLYARLPATVKRLFSGKFGDTLREQVCALLADNTLRCYWVGSGAAYLQPAWAQTSIVGDDEHALVGDYDGNGYDDVLVYKPAAGTFRLYTRDVNTGTFALMPRFVLGNLGVPSDFINRQIRVGELHSGASPRRDDLIVYNPDTRQISRYSARTDTEGRSTFWWAFTTGAVGTLTDEIQLANVDGDSTEDVVLHDQATGRYRFFKAEYSGGSLVPIDSNYESGQLFNGKNSRVFFAKLKNFASEAGVLRDDAISYDPSTGTLVVVHARWSGFKYTYWWAWTQLPLIPGLDQDGDGLLTRDELGATDRDGNGVSDVPLMAYGASPFVRDVFVEVDYMAAPTGETISHVFKPQAVTLAVQEMAKAGINLHVFVDEQIPYQNNLGLDFDWTNDFDPLKNKYFTRARWPLFHYCIFADRYGRKGSSGLSRGIPGSDFIVTLGAFDGNAINGSVSEQAGTFLHELGHNLGLQHGGLDSVGRKPNFFSIMNYNYQFIGVQKDGSQQFLYSEFTTKDLDEGAVNESLGVVGTPPTGTTYRAWVTNVNAWVSLNSSVDFNTNGRLESAVRVNLNPDDEGGPSVIGLLSGAPNEYLLLQFKAGAIGSSAAAGLSDSDAYPSRSLASLLLATADVPEATHDFYLKHVVPMLPTVPPIDLGKLSVVRPLRQTLVVPGATRVAP